MVKKSDNPIVDPIRVVRDESGDIEAIKANIQFNEKDELTYSDYDEDVAKGLERYIEKAGGALPILMAANAYMLGDDLSQKQQARMFGQIMALLPQEELKHEEVVDPDSDFWTGDEDGA